ncbi:lipopolysaccharide biosynthesis protein [Halomonas daqiaonensis]|uniref:Membrane protein involved in the export of O-antigen and teichoic acid n=1 Tax=Halomonas daqiaonensis TaxID=650850 RepID=A0A1H7HHT6_9GAMM|nr:oligosaccharide flippase family protein [Halomonas daqiaonensis]SEK49861.1 Membrane protein involved in the export of O-antigen and teichoic acid [Halomonas daqiaonensis]
MNQRMSGAMLSYLLILVKLVVTLLFTPFMLSSLGTEGYGLFALAGAMAAYLMILDFGMNDAILRFFVAHENDREKRDAFLGRMLSLYAVLAGLVLLAAVGFSTLAEPVFGASNTPRQVEMLRVMFLYIGSGTAVLVALNPFGALLSATESFVFLRGLEIASTLVTTLALVAVLLAGYGPVEVVLVTASFTALQALLRLGFAVLRIEVRVRLAWPALDELRSVGGYAAPILLVIVAEAIFWKFDAILIGALLGAAPVAVYAIGVTFNKYFMSFATAISRIMTPEIVRRIDAGADAETLTDLMIRISRAQALVLLMILGGLIVFGEQFLTLWLGAEFAASYPVMLLVLVPYALELTGNVRNIVLQVKGLYWYKSAITLGMAALNIPLTVVLLKIWGVSGAAASTGLAVIAGYLVIAILLQRRVGIKMGRYWRETWRGIFPAFAGLVAVGLVGASYLPAGWIGLVMGSMLFAAAYLVAMLGLAATQSERDLCRRAVRGALPGRRRHA